MTSDTWHVTPNKWHVTCDMWHMVGGKHSLKISAYYLYWFGIHDAVKIGRKRMTKITNEWITSVFVEYPRHTTGLLIKLDGVGPVDNRPFTDKLHQFVKKKIKCDMWHMTRDTCHLPCDMWHMTHRVGWTFSQNLSSLALPVWDWECLEHILTKGWVNQWISKWRRWL